MHTQKDSFSFFLSIYSQCGTPAFLAVQHTTVCLDCSSMLIATIQIQRKIKYLPTQLGMCDKKEVPNFLSTYFGLWESNLAWIQVELKACHKLRGLKQ